MKYYQLCHKCGVVSLEQSMYKLGTLYFCTEEHLREYAEPKNQSKKRDFGTTLIIVLSLIYVGLVLAHLVYHYAPSAIIFTEDND